MSDDGTSEAERNFRWAYQLLLALAKRCLDDANREVAGTDDWPRGQQWHELSSSSQSSFLHTSREEAGIDHDEFLAAVRGEYADIAVEVFEAQRTSGAGGER